jgi:hypothetical protein
VDVHQAALMYPEEAAKQMLDQAVASTMNGNYDDLYRMSSSIDQCTTMIHNEFAGMFNCTT